MAPIHGGLTVKQSKNVPQLPCEVAFAGFYPPLFCLQEPEPSDTIHTRGLNPSNDAATSTSPNSKAWPTKIQEVIHDQRTWIAFVLGLLALISIASLCYQCCKGSIKKRRRRAGGNTAGRHTREKRTDLPSPPRSDPFMQFTQRKEVGAAEQRAQKLQEQVTRASGGIQTSSVVIQQTELHDLESIHDDLSDEARRLSLQDGDFQLRRQNSNVDLRQPTVTHTCPNSDKSRTRWYLVEQPAFPPASDSLQSRVSMPPPSYGSQHR